MDSNWVIIAGVLFSIIGIVALPVVPPNRKPGRATAWLMLIFLALFLGRSCFSSRAALSSRADAAPSSAIDDWIKHQWSVQELCHQSVGVLFTQPMYRHEPLAVHPPW